MDINSNDGVHGGVDHPTDVAVRVNVLGHEAKSDRGQVVIYDQDKATKNSSDVRQETEGREVAMV